MSPEKILTRVMKALEGMGLDPVTAGATGPDADLTVIIRFRSPADLDLFTDLTPDFNVRWDVKVAPGVLR